MNGCSRPRRIVACVLVLVVLAPWTAAAQAVTVLEASGDVWLAAYADYSPTPVGWAEWHHAIADGPAFAGELTIPETPWQWGYAVRCGADGLAASATWADLDPDPEAFFSVDVDMRMECLVQVATTVGLVADCDRAGNLGAALERGEQTVVITYPDGTVATVLDRAAGVVHAALTLAPGSYRIAVAARYLERDEQDAMAAHVTLDWVDAALPIDDASWSAVHAIFR